MNDPTLILKMANAMQECDVKGGCDYIDMAKAALKAYKDYEAKAMEMDEDVEEYLDCMDAL